MILTTRTGPAPAFTADTYPSQQAYADRLGLPYHIHQATGDPFEHRLPAILSASSLLTDHCSLGTPLLYLEWDVRVADDAPDILPLLGDADLLLPLHTDLDHAAFLSEKVPGLTIPWHIIGVMLGRREAFEAIHREFPACRTATTALPWPNARYEAAVLLAIQRSGIKLGTLPHSLHKFARKHHRAAFLHFEGDTKAKLKGKLPTMLCGSSSLVTADNNLRF